MDAIPVPVVYSMDSDVEGGISPEVVSKPKILRSNFICDIESLRESNKTKISAACNGKKNKRDRLAAEKQLGDEMNSILNSSELFLRTELLPDTKKPKLDNDNLSTNVVILTAPGLTVEAPYSKVFELCQTYLNHKGFSYSNSSLGKHITTLPPNDASFLFTRNSSTKLSQASVSGDNMIVYNSSTIGRDSGKKLPNVVSSELNWRQAIKSKGS